jgi:hypothetical protein
MTTTPPFDTETFIAGSLREPKQMLAEQEYGGHLSIHDDATAEKLGFAAGPIEGPTHFSQFVPLLVDVWGERFLEQGCISFHFQNVCTEGDRVRAFVERPGAEAGTCLRLWAEKSDGTPVLTGTATIGPDFAPSELDERMARLRPAEKLLILEDLEVGMKGEGLDAVSMDFDQHMGNFYPFTLGQKLEVITEPSPYYTAAEGPQSPWKRPIIPWEMVSVLAEHKHEQTRFPVKGPAIGLFADQEIKMLQGPLFVGHPYLLEREIAALSESRRTESHWVRTRILDADTRTCVAEMLLNHATLKESYVDYQ